MNVVSLIPARAGSRGVPDKNIAPLAGKPLIYWTIRAAREAGCIDRVIVSTDSPQIADVASSLGAEAPFLRPSELAGDDSSSIEFVIHAINWLKQAEQYSPHIVVLLQPTSPLRTKKDIVEAIHVFQDKAGDNDTLISVKPAEIHPNFFFTIDDSGCMKELIKGGRKARRQDMPQVFRPNGAIYIGGAEYLLSSKRFEGDRTLAYIMPEERSLDIDEPWHLQLAELRLREQLSRLNTRRHD